MRKAIRASALILLLVCSVQAGDMGNGAPAPPPSQPVTAAAQEPNTDGYMGNGMTDGYMANDAVISFTQVVLNLLTLP